MRRLITICGLFLLCLARPAHAVLPYFMDGTDHKVSYGQHSQRIVSLAPNVTEMLFFLGLGSRVVGRTDYCNYPPEALKLPAVGGMVDTSLEKIVALKPDLVIAYQVNSLELISQLRKLGIEVLAFHEAGSLAEIGTQMNEIVWVTDGRMQRSAASAHWMEQLNGYRNKRDNNAKGLPTVFYGMPGEITYTAASGFINDLIYNSNAWNAVTPKAGLSRWPQVGPEFVLAAQPDWLLISTPCTGHTEIGKASDDIRKSLAKDPVWGKLKAVQQGHIVVINADVLLRPGPRILDALEQLETALHGGGK